MRKWLMGFAAVALVGVLAAAPAVSQAPSGAPTGKELGHVRFEKTFNVEDHWEASSGSDESDRAILFQDSLTTPSSVEKVDVVATATIDFRTSPTDRGDIQMDIRSNSMSPGEYKYSSPAGSKTTTTFTWVRKRLEAGGKDYIFQLETGSEDGADADDSASVKGKRITVVIEMWPSD